MDLKILYIILVYYAFISGFFILGGNLFANYSYSVHLNDSSTVSHDELDKGGLFGTGISFTRFLSLVTVGIGLPADTPGWFKVIFAIWQTLFLIFVIGWFISSIWNG